MQTYLHVSSLAKYLHIHGGQTVDLKRDDLMISLGLSRIKQHIDLHCLVRNQDSWLTVNFQMSTVLILTLDTAKTKRAGTSEVRPLFQKQFSRTLLVSITSRLFGK